MNTTMRTIAKLGGTGLTIGVIGWGILTFSGDPAQPTKTAQADLSFMNFAPTTKHERVVDTLMKEGFEKPRTYDWNGNKFHFTLKHTADTPLEATRKLQHAFKNNKVNKKAHVLAPEPINMVDVFNIKDIAKNGSEAEKRKFADNILNHKARLDDFFDGGIVPFKMDSDYITMAGASLKEPVKDGQSIHLAKRFMQDIKNKRKLDKNIDRIYSIEAFRAPGSRRTTMTAMWSQDNLDLDKFNPKKKPESNANRGIPTCFGCERIMTFKAQKEETGYANNVFTSNHLSPADAHKFYRTSLGTRGWKRSKATSLLQKALKDGLMPNYGADIESYSRGKDFITVIAHPSEVDARQTMIQVMESR